MNNLISQNHNEYIEMEVALQKYEEDTERLTISNDHMSHQVRFYGRNIRDLENFNDRYWNTQVDYNQIVNNEEKRYDYFKNKEQAIVCDINRPNKAIQLWRYKDTFYYRPNLFHSLIIGDEKMIAEEISSRYSNINIVFVSDLNDALFYKKMNIRIDTTYIAKNSIPTVDEEIFDITRMEEININCQGSYSRNTLSYSIFLINRFYDFDLENEPKSYAKRFIQNMTTIKDLRFLATRLGKFFKHLNSSNAVVLIGHKVVSEGILLNRVLKPIFGSQFCVTITDEMLQINSLEDIVKNKLVYHIDHIPEDEQDREKLREILISILVDKFIMIEDKFVPVYGQVIITIDEVHPFITDFLSSSDVFFVDSMKNIMSKLQVEDKISFHNKLYNSLMPFSKELSVIGNIPCDILQNNNQNKEFINLLENMDEEILKLVQSNLLDPFDDNFENLIPLIERYKHTYITGQTGSGKSELLKTLILRDILRADGNVIL